MILFYFLLFFILFFPICKLKIISDPSFLNSSVYSDLNDKDNNTKMLKTGMDLWKVFLKLVTIMINLINTN